MSADCWYIYSVHDRRYGCFLLVSLSSYLFSMWERVCVRCLKFIMCSDDGVAFFSSSFFYVFFLCLGLFFFVSSLFKCVKKISKSRCESSTQQKLNIIITSIFLHLLKSFRFRRSLWSVCGMHVCLGDYLLFFSFTRDSILYLSV